MKIVDIEPMLAFLDDNHDEKDWVVSQYNADWIYSWLESQPAISPDSLVKRGQWVKDSSGLYSCSECGKTAPYREIECAIEYWPELRHCHYCGALMED